MAMYRRTKNTQTVYDSDPTDYTDDELPETEYDPRKIAGPGRHAIAAEIASKSDLFNCSGKAPAVLRSIYQ